MVIQFPLCPLNVAATLNFFVSKVVYCQSIKHMSTKKVTTDQHGALLTKKEQME